MALALIIKEAVYSHADKGPRIQTQNSEEYIHRYRTINHFLYFGMNVEISFAG